MSDTQKDSMSKGLEPRPKLEPSWLERLKDEFEKDYMKDLKAFLVEEKKLFHVFPAGADVFNAFSHTPFDKVKVVVLGQDPYHGSGQAHGLCFSVNEGVPLPPSLKNIFKELKSDLGLLLPATGCLSPWARQGVFLLNTVLTVRERAPQSHAGKGWEIFTNRVIQELNENREGLVFVLWGKPAQKKAELIDPHRHLILTAHHPSPLSASRGFFGCRHFSKINAYLKSKGEEAIDWQL